MLVVIITLRYLFLLPALMIKVNFLALYFTLKFFLTEGTFENTKCLLFQRGLSEIIMFGHACHST